MKSGSLESPRTVCSAREMVSRALLHSPGMIINYKCVLGENDATFANRSSNQWMVTSYLLKSILISINNWQVCQCCTPFTQYSLCMITIDCVKSIAYTLI